MENIAEYIPLLLVIGSLIFSAITGSKKKEKKANERPLPPFDSIPYEEEEELVYIPEYIESEVEVRPAIEQIVPEKRLEPKKNKIRPSSVEIKINQESETEPFLNVQNLDEVKKAIVYSEIFNRKEY